MIEFILSKCRLTTFAFFILTILACQQALCRGIELRKAVQTAALPADADEKIGQLFLIGFPGQRLSPEVTMHIQKHKFGNFILFRRNISSPRQLKELTSSLHSSLLGQNLPMPLIAVDQEGGRVTRIPTFPKLPSPQSIGRVEDHHSSYEFAKESGRILRESGVNLNLAPVLDLGSPRLNSFISSRSFSDDSDSVDRYGYLYGKAMIENGVVPTAKHFPGSSNVSADPHHQTYSVLRSKAELIKHEINAFKSFTRLGRFAAIMLSHYHYTAFDQEYKPASLSNNVISYLRNDLNFKGLIVTDDFQMDGVRALLNPAESAFQALKSGADLVMLTYSPKDQIQALNRLKTGILNNEISWAEIDQKLERIRFVKSHIKGPLSHRTPASWQSPSLLQLDEELVEEHLSQLPAKFFNKGLVCILGQKHSSALELELELKRRGIQFAKINPKKFEPRCKKTISFIWGQGSYGLFTEVQKMFPKIDNFGINIGNPSLVTEKDSSKVVNLYFPHTSAPKKIAELLESSAIQ